MHAHFCRGREATKTLSLSVLGGSSVQRAHPLCRSCHRVLSFLSVTCFLFCPFPFFAFYLSFSWKESENPPFKPHMYHSEDPIPSSPFVNISSTGQSVTMATFLKQNPPNGVPMSARATGQRKGKRAMADADSQTGSESPKQERSLAQRGEFVQRDTK